MKKKNFSKVHVFNTINPETGATELTEFNFDNSLRRREAFRYLMVMSEHKLAEKQEDI